MIWDKRRVYRDAVFQSVVAGSTAYYDFPIGRCFHGIQLAYATLADLEQIRIQVNGNDVMKFTAARLVEMNDYAGLPASASTSGYLYVPFEDITSLFADPNAAELYSFNTGVADAQGVSINSLRIEVDIASGAASPTLDGLVVSSYVDPMIGQREHQILYRRTFTESGLVTGENQISVLPFRSQRELFFRRATFIPSANAISEIKLEINNEIVQEGAIGAIENLQKIGDGRIAKVPQSGYEVFDRADRGRLINDIPMAGVQDFRFLVTATGALNATILYETVGRLQG